MPNDMQRRWHGRRNKLMIHKTCKHEVRDAVVGQCDNEGLFAFDLIVIVLVEGSIDRWK